MNQNIPFTPRDFFKIYETGFFLNLELSIDFHIDRFADRSHLLNKDYEGATVLVNWYDFSLDTLDQSSDYCQAIVTATPIPKYRDSIPQFIVKDVRQFMYKLAEYMRQRYKNPFIAVTGSAGKSTTSKMLAHVLKDDEKESLVNMGNHNNRPSVSFYTANIVSNPDYMVLEIAGDSFIKHYPSGNLAELAKPEIGMITSIGGAHLSRYKDDLSVAELKSSLIDGIKTGGLLVINQDIEQEQREVFVRKAEAKKIKLMTYSLWKNDTDAYLISKIWDGKHAVVTAQVQDKLVTYRLPSGAEGTIQNSLGVLLVLKYLGVELDEKRLSKFETTPMLAKVMAHKEFELTERDRLTLVDDTHNSSIPAMHNSIKYFKALVDSGLYTGNKFLVFGKTADLGAQSQELHYQFIQPIVESGADFVFLYGDQMKELMRELRKQRIFAYHYINLDELVEDVADLISGRSLVLMKGSVSDSDFFEISTKLPQKINQFGWKQV